MWYSRVVANLAEIPNFIAHYEAELEQARLNFFRALKALELEFNHPPACLGGKLIESQKL